MPPIAIDREAAREAAENELSKPIYPRGSLTDRFNAWLDELIFRIVAKGDLLPGVWFTGQRPRRPCDRRGWLGAGAASLCPSLRT